MRDPTVEHLIDEWIFSISIHRSLAGPDGISILILEPIFYFNPQVPCGTRHKLTNYRIAELEFQSTGPLRDPTSLHILLMQADLISIHRSLAGPDANLLNSLIMN